MKYVTILAVILLVGCETIADLRAMPPAASFKTTATVDEVRDCTYRWTSVAQFTVSYRPDGAVVQSGSEPIFIVRVEGENVHVHMGANSFGSKKRINKMVFECAKRPSSNPPSDSYWLFYQGDFSTDES